MDGGIFVGRLVGCVAEGRSVGGATGRRVGISVGGDTGRVGLNVLMVGSIVAIGCNDGCTVEGRTEGTNRVLGASVGSVVSASVGASVPFDLVG